MNNIWKRSFTFIFLVRLISQTLLVGGKLLCRIKGWSEGKREGFVDSSIHNFTVSQSSQHGAQKNIRYLLKIFFNFLF